MVVDMQAEVHTEVAAVILAAEEALEAVTAAAILVAAVPDHVFKRKYKSKTIQK